MEWDKSVTRQRGVYPYLGLRDIRAHATPSVLNVHAEFLTIVELELDLVNGVKIDIIKGHDSSFFDSIVLANFICSLTQEKQLMYQ